MKTLILALILCGSSAIISAQEWPGPTVHKKTTTKYYMHTGFTFDAVLRTAIFSYNTNTPVIAEVEYDISYLGAVMVPKGTKLIGTSAVEKTDNRVNVTFHTMVFPNGEEIGFNGLALWPDGSAGIIGKVDKKKSVLPAKILLTAAVTSASMATNNAAVPNEMMKSLATDANNDLAQKQETSVSVPKDIGILIYITTRMEY